MGESRRLNWQEIVNLAQAEDRLRREMSATSNKRPEELLACMYVAQPEPDPSTTNRSRPPAGVSEPKRNSSQRGRADSRQRGEHPSQTWRPKCSHCGVVGHTVETCYRLKGARGSPRTNKKPVRCSWCGGRTHEADNCWIRAGRCPGRGGTDHDRARCPKDEYKPTCPQCGGGHLGRYCDKSVNL